MLSDLLLRLDKRLNSSLDAIPGLAYPSKPIERRLMMSCLLVSGVDGAPRAKYEFNCKPLSSLWTLRKRHGASAAFVARRGGIMSPHLGRGQGIIIQAYLINGSIELVAAASG